LHGLRFWRQVPNAFSLNNGASLSILSSEASSVSESSTSLAVEWQPLVNDNGFNITEYLIEYWTLPGTHEIQQLSLSYNGDVSGTFTLLYGDDSTISLPFDASAQLLEDALSSFNLIRSIHVDKSATASETVWTVTFMSAYPSIAGELIQVSTETNLVDETNLSNEPQFIISVIAVGNMPSNYKAIHVPVDNSSQKSPQGYIWIDTQQGVLCPNLCRKHNGTWHSKPNKPQALVVSKAKARPEIQCCH
jgi:hypothetical protein